MGAFDGAQINDWRITCQTLFIIEQIFITSFEGQSFEVDTYVYSISLLQ